jgi:hypothetical protein
MTVCKIFVILTAVLMSFLLQKSKRGKSDQAEQASPCNAIKEMPVETQKGSDLPHVSPSDIMLIPKADAALKRKKQTRGSTAILTSSPYFKGLKEKKHPTLHSSRRPVPSNRQLFGKCGAKPKKRLRMSIPDTDTQNGMRHAYFVTSCFPHQNPEKSGLNAQVATNGHTYTYDEETENMYMCDFCKECDT